MSSLKAFKLILAIASASVLAMSCQKATPRAIKALVGKGGSSKTAPLTEADKKLDEAMKSDKVITCTADFIKNKTAFDTDLVALNKKVSDNKGKKIEQALIIELEKSSLELKKKSEVLFSELVKASASGCKSQKIVLILDLKNSLNTALIAAADLAGKENAASIIARQEKKRFEGDQTSASLVNQSFSITKELTESFEEANLVQKTHFIGGKIVRGQSELDIALEQNIHSLCVLKTALKQKISKEVKMSVLDLQTSVLEKPFEVGSQKLVKVIDMVLHLSLEDQIISVECRLAKTAAISDTEKEFKDIFSDLIAK